MKIDIVNVSPYVTNCYILTIDNDVLVIDPGGNFEKINPFLKDKNILGAIITHGHDDHNSAVFNFKNIYDYNNLKEGQHNIGPFAFDVIYTPGHTSDSITIYFKENKLMFTGDFLFKNTVGRMDLPTGSLEDMKNSLNKIKKYSNVKVYPGHGDFTTLDYEKENNIYFLNL